MAAKFVRRNASSKPAGCDRNTEIKVYFIPGMARKRLKYLRKPLIVGKKSDIIILKEAVLRSERSG